MRKITLWIAASLFASAVRGAAPAPELAAREPLNLDAAKAAVRAYVASGEYERQITAVAAEATEWISTRAKQGGPHLAVVFDLDETLLSNYELIEKQDFAYNPPAWNAWVAEGRARAIEPVRVLYRIARGLKLEVIFLSGRREGRDRAGTEKNLKALGCGDYSALILKPADAEETTGAFKLARRRQLTAEGFAIIANIGDQTSDLEGGFAEKTFKLPCPFYLTK
jgi:predicted secreted acid phosphatase